MILRRARRDVWLLLLLAVLPAVAYAPAWMGHRLLGSGDGAALHFPLRALVWESYGREHDRLARTVVLKLKTSDFRILTRSLTPEAPPASERELVDIALALRERVDQPPRTRYRLVGVGLGGFCEAEAMAVQPALL